MTDELAASNYIKEEGTGYAIRYLFSKKLCLLSLTILLNIGTSFFPNIFIKYILLGCMITIGIMIIADVVKEAKRDIRLNVSSATITVDNFSFMADELEAIHIYANRSIYIIHKQARFFEKAIKLALKRKEDRVPFIQDLCAFCQANGIAFRNEWH